MKPTPDRMKLLILMIVSVGICLAGLATGQDYLRAQGPIPTLTPTITYLTAVYPPRPHTPTATLVPDDEPPVMTLFVTGEQLTNGWYYAPIGLTFLTIDDLSGPGKSWYKFGDETEWHYTENGFPPIVITRTGVYSLYYYAEDMNYNVETPPHSRTLIVVEGEVRQIYLPLILKSSR